MRRFEAFLLGAAVLGMAALTIANVVARNVFGGNLAAVEELNEFLIVLICFVGLSHAASLGRHIRMTALHDQLGPSGRRRVLVLVSAVTAAVLATLAWYAGRYALSVERVSPVLGVSLKWVYLCAPIGLGLGALQYLLALLRNLTSARPWVAYERPDEYLDVPEGL